jgi:hypothetical protein
MRKLAITTQCRQTLWRSWVRWPSPMIQQMNGRLHHEQKVLLGQRTKKSSRNLGGNPFVPCAKNETTTTNHSLA